MTLYAAASLELLRELTHQPMEGQPADQQLGGLSEPTDLPERNSTRAEAVASKTAAVALPRRRRRPGGRRTASQTLLGWQEEGEAEGEAGKQQGAEWHRGHRTKNGSATM